MGKKRFTVLQGRDQGMEFSLDEGESYIIGREQQHEAGLTDLSASRTHCNVENADTLQR